jgi:hypothetical protein
MEKLIFGTGLKRYEVNDNGVKRTLYNIDKPALMEVYHVKASEG